MMTTEMGKTIVAARAEVLKCAKGCRFYAEHAESMLADEPADAAAVGATRAYVRYEPLGPVLAVMPWNFPLWQVIRFAAPALMAGNVGLLKHASNVPQTALLIEDTFRRAGFPEGAFQTLLIGASSVERILRDPRARRDAHREHAGRSFDRKDRRRGAQAGRARARRQRSVRGDARRPTSRRRRRPRSPRACRTTGRAASPRSGSSSTTTWPTRSRSCSWRACRRCGSAIRWTSRPTSARSPTSRACSTSRRTSPTRSSAARAAVRWTTARSAGMVLSADGRHRRHARHAHVPRGDLRSGRAVVPGR